MHQGKIHFYDTHSLFQNHLIINMKNRLFAFTASACVLWFSGRLTSTAQTINNSAPSHLVVVICVDGMQSEHLSLLWPSLGKGGFRRIVEHCWYAPNTTCNYDAAGRAADYASFITGTMPRYHGITGDRLYSVVEDATISIVADGKYNGIGSHLGTSPKNLQVMTLGDVLKTTHVQAKVYAVAPTPECAVMLGGHLADGAVWVADNGRLASSDYYNNMPLWADRMNSNDLITKYIQSAWRPIHRLPTYRFPARRRMSEKEECFYRPNPQASTEERVMAFRQTPYCNTLMKDLAIKALQEEHLGTDAFTDLLCVQFTANPVGQDYGVFNSAEREDLYLKLDKDVELLLNAIDARVGLNNTIVVLMGTRMKPYPIDALERSRVSHGNFNTIRATALLNGYLMSIYGQGRWVSNIYARNITLNHALIEKQKINLNEIRHAAASFMTQFEGVLTAYTQEQIALATGNDDNTLIRLQNGQYKQRSGDVVITLLPGWQEVDANGQTIAPLNAPGGYLPVFIATGKSTQQLASQTVQITDIVPTLCYLLQLPQPNAATGKILNVK